VSSALTRTVLNALRRTNVIYARLDSTVDKIRTAVQHALSLTLSAELVHLKELVRPAVQDISYPIMSHALVALITVRLAQVQLHA
jgi:hypothetical protein